jgi:hypothetical protein
MASPLDLRLDEKTSKLISRVAQRKQLSTSEVVRQVIEAWADRHEPVASPYEAVKDLIGIVHSGNPKGSVRTGRRFTKLLKRRRSAS